MLGFLAAHAENDLGALKALDELRSLWNYLVRNEETAKAADLIRLAPHHPPAFPAPPPPHARGLPRARRSQGVGREDRRPPRRPRSILGVLQLSGVWSRVQPRSLQARSAAFAKGAVPHRLVEEGEASRADPRSGLLRRHDWHPCPESLPGRSLCGCRYDGEGARCLPRTSDQGGTRRSPRDSPRPRR